MQIGTKEDSRKAFVNVVSTTASADWLNRAKFVASFSSGSYAYFLFQEIDEMITPGRKQVFCSSNTRKCFLNRYLVEHRKTSYERKFFHQKLMSCVLIHMNPTF